jgi:hypothetical protein
MIVVLLLQIYASQLSLLKNFFNDSDPKTITKCKKRLDWNKWKEAIKAELNSLKKRKLFKKLYLHLPEPLLLGSNGFLFEREMRIMSW